MRTQVKIEKLLILIFIATILNGCQKENKDLFKTTELENGFPEILKPLEKDLPFKILSHSILESKNDSIDIYFGSLKQGKQNGNWIALSANNKIKQFSTVDFKRNSENEKENDIDLQFNSSKNRVSLRIKELDTISNRITYSWINQNTLTDSLKVLTIDKPLAKGKIFPSIELTDINGEKLDLDNFNEQTIVINWWAVWCVPCRKGNPHLISLFKKYNPKGLEIIGVSDDDRAKDKWRKAVEKDQIGIWYQILRGTKTIDGKPDFNDKSTDISNKYNISSLPTKILVGPDGVIIGRYGGGGGTDEDMDKDLLEIFKN